MTIDRRAFLRSASSLAVMGLSYNIAARNAWAQSDVTVRLGLTRAAGQSGALLVAIENDGFTKHGLKMQRAPLFTASAAIGPALISGSLDIAPVGDVPSIPIFASGEPIKALCPVCDFSADQAIVVKESISEPAQLAGARIALYKGSVATLFIERYADIHDIDVNSIKLIHMDPAQQLPALASGDVDGFISWEPFIWSGTERLPGAHVLARASDPEKYMRVYSLLVVRESFMEENHEAVKSFVAAVADGMDEINSNDDSPERIARLTQKMLNMDLPMEVLADMAQRRTYTMAIDSAFMKAQEQNTKFLYDQGRIKKPVDVMSWLDTSILREIRPDLVTI